MIPWLKKRDIGLLVGNGGLPAAAPGRSNQERHAQLRSGDSGVHILDRADLEASVKLRRHAKRWEFMLTVAPLPIPHGTGSPVNPLAMF